MEKTLITYAGINGKTIKIKLIVEDFDNLLEDDKETSKLLFEGMEFDYRTLEERRKE